MVLQLFKYSTHKIQIRCADLSGKDIPSVLSPSSTLSGPLVPLQQYYCL